MGNWDHSGKENGLRLRTCICGERATYRRATSYFINRPLEQSATALRRNNLFYEWSSTTGWFPIENDGQCWGEEEFSLLRMSRILSLAYRKCPFVLREVKIDLLTEQP